MRVDEKGLDTIFGALILILVCAMSSSVFIAVTPSFGDISQDILDLENKYDCILSSTLDLEYSIGGIEIDRPVSVETYAIEMLCRSPGNVLPPVNNASGEISPLIDFYFGGFEGWTLRINEGHPDQIELASRGRMDANGGNTYILSRPLIGRNGGEASLELTIVQ
ncbi:MAG TPA: hypothetical protein VMW02_01065 [Thermoplasmata archaeon]|nr:hypothetical protein [Thermoplasmata archaeon]